MLFKQKRFSDTGNQSDNLSKVQGELDELKGIMVKNIGKCLIFCSSHFEEAGIISRYWSQSYLIILFFLNTMTVESAENHFEENVLFYTQNSLNYLTQK